MKMTKKALTAMIAVSIAATALPAAAMVSNLSNTLTSSNSAGTNNAAPQIGTTTTPQTTTPTATPETGAPAVQAEPSPASMFTTEDVDGGVAITGFNIAEGDPTDIVIPPTINNKTVVALKSNNGSKCMTGADKITSLDTSLCTSLSIGDLAFYRCTNNLASVNLSGCNSIGTHAFYSCTGITSVDLSGITSIGTHAFYNCTGITGSIDLSGCNSIRESAFSRCLGITKVTWPTDKMPIIPSGCFSGCNSLRTFNSDTDGVFNLSGITSIEKTAFRECIKITGSVDLSSCNTVGDYAFNGCINLKPTISTKATTVGSSAFSNCPYVIIQADSEAALASYCSGITSTDTSTLKGLSPVKKLASIPGVTNQIPAALSYDLTGNIPDGNATYYLTASQNSDYTAPDGYVDTNVYDIALKGVKNGESAVSTMSGTVPISITPDSYIPTASYYLNVDGTLSTNAITPTQNDDGTYTFTQDVALGESGSTVALVYRNIQVSTITVTGDNTVPYSENGTVELSAKITPDNALNQNVTWSSDNENVLKFTDPNSGAATIVGMGTATITATATDGSNVKSAPYSVTITPALGTGYTIDYANEKISAIDDGYEVSKNPDFATLLKAEDSVAPGETLYVRAKDTTVYAENKLPERPATPTTPEITQTAKMVQVTNGADGQEYMFKKPTDTNHTATFDVWQDSPVLIDDTMTDGVTYTVTTRVKATDTSFASEESSSDAYKAKDVPKNSASLDGGSNGDEWTDGTATYNADTPYEIPVRLKTAGGDTYMVEIDWGNMLFSYNFGTWDTETLSYNDDPATLHWGTSFDGTNNQVTVINRSSNAIESTIGLTVDADKQAELEHLGFHLTADNKNSEDPNDYYPTEATTLQKGPTGNSTTAYVNIKSDDTKPNDSILEKYSQEVDGTQIGNITVQKAN